jgi:hypothetical protein
VVIPTPWTGGGSWREPHGLFRLAAAGDWCSAATVGVPAIEGTKRTRAVVAPAAAALTTQPMAAPPAATTLEPLVTTTFATAPAAANLVILGQTPIRRETGLVPATSSLGSYTTL